MNTHHTEPTIRGLDPATEQALREYIRTRLTEVRYSDLALHLVSAHCNAAGLNNTRAEALDNHHHEHHGPGGIRNHPTDDLFFDVDKIATVLLECTEPDNPKDLNNLTAMKAAIDDLMERPNEVTRIAPGAHLHNPAIERAINESDQAIHRAERAELAGYAGEQCQTTQCDAYPRLYDVAVTRTPDGDFKNATWTALFTHDEDLAETTRLARTALSKATAALKGLEHNYQSARILPEVTNTQARFANLPLNLRSDPA